MIDEESLRVDLRNAFSSLRERMYSGSPDIEVLTSLNRTLGASYIHQFADFPHPEEDILIWFRNWVYRYLSLIEYLSIFEKIIAQGNPNLSIIRYPYLARRHLDSDDNLPSREVRDIIKNESVKCFYHDDMEQLIFCLFMCAKHVDTLREMERGRGHIKSFPLWIKEALTPFVTDCPRQVALCHEIIQTIDLLKR